MSHVSNEGFEFDIVQSVSGVTPQAAYSAWAAELGVPATGTVKPLDDNDIAWAVALAAPIVTGGADFAFSSEGAVGVSQRPLQGLSTAFRTLPGVNRMIDMSPASPLLFTFHPQTDCRSEAVTLQRSGSTTILAGRIRVYYAESYVLNFAVRLEPGSLRFILAPIDQPVAFNIFNQRDVALIEPIAMAPGALTRIDVTQLQYQAPVYEAYLSPLHRIGQGAVLNYGKARSNRVAHLSVAEGKVKDLITGLLGKGIGRVYGTVQRKTDPANTPLKRKVRLVRERDGLVVREVWSDAVTGGYDFRYIDELQTWTVIAYDHEHNFRAVVADNITAELIT